MTTGTKELIQKIASGDAVGAGEVLNNIMSDKSMEALQSRKVELAKSIFNSSENLDTEEIEAENQ